MTATRREPEYVACVSNKGYRASLIERRIYRVLRDSEATKRGLLRVIDESGEDYLYPAELFVSVELPKAVGKQFAEAS